MLESASTSTPSTSSVNENDYYKALGLVTVQQLRRQQLNAILEKRFGGGTSMAGTGDGAGGKRSKSKQDRSSESDRDNDSATMRQTRIQTRNNGQRPELRMTRKRKLDEQQAAEAAATKVINAKSPSSESTGSRSETCSPSTDKTVATAQQQALQR